MSTNKTNTLSWAILFGGFLFLYLPIFILIVYSFNESRLVTVWAGFSTKWYGELFEDEQMMNAVWMSLKIAFLSASAAVALGTLAAIALVRSGAFKGKTLFTGMITAPLVMPEVITGLSLLLLFVTLSQMIGWPSERGAMTIWIAHTTFNMAYVAVVVSARLRELDQRLEEAAMDLGANKLQVFIYITLPIVAPALLAGWLLAFTLSLDDLVIASFVSGPGSTTLPMVVFSSVRLGVSPKINALATLLVLAVSVAAFIAWWIMRRNELQRQKEIQSAYSK
ncbi:spermidine/putrescine ABC transporter permease [Oleiphilus sp. HI0071]|uniref:ABC transporter permease subunit n=1 Tax=unclassified Oleiphilus TaxID=2631174 RepID=UPI0007C2C815|nr:MULTISPECIES: ABC transporter permease subunit [unclassified Oleiphilus]KZY68009.1 spermidine/putrescine ABC transporter permease [Oleiphilus sp. HI0065]KZY78424.1 spermidine/putrescine ABC transporter permease [Oleiphilus sp. HI0071]KZZ01401.1 spermidine/putrescine ABC transporter permease [Oleiphilus sp. HI0073]KZZ51679.1 spermidine/putrescine ABC transporter permease [Oleiphilus sp. HI0122]KZZ54850.1 spermidine/putrescine ABC transporter permease [Oleiphilus sp. HI0118]KZZ68975.1 spermi